MPSALVRSSIRYPVFRKEYGMKFSRIPSVGKWGNVPLGRALPCFFNIVYRWELLDFEKITMLDTHSVIALAYSLPSNFVSVYRRQLFEIIHICKC